MDVTVIIPTITADEPMLERCIAQVKATTNRDAEIIVPQGGTFAANCNFGANEASGNVVVFLNDDTLPQPGWLEPLVAALDDAVIAGSRLIYPDGTIQHAGVYLTNDDGILTAHNELMDRPSRLVDAVTGACMAMTKANFDMFGGFDTAYRNGYEDVDLCLRVRSEGYPIAYCADSTVIHYESRSGAPRWSHVQENIQLLQDRWSHLLTQTSSESKANSTTSN